MNKKIQKEINNKVNEYILNNHLDIEEIEIKGHNSKYNRVKVKDIKSSIIFKGLNLYKLDCSYRVYYSNGGNAYNVYISKELFIYISRLMTDIYLSDERSV